MGKRKDRRSKRRDKSDALKRINFASAYSILPWRLTVGENLSFYAEIYEVPDKKKEF